MQVAVLENHFNCLRYWSNKRTQHTCNYVLPLIWEILQTEGNNKCIPALNRKVLKLTLLMTKWSLSVCVGRTLCYYYYIQQKQWYIRKYYQINLSGKQCIEQTDTHTHILSPLSKVHLLSFAFKANALTTESSGACCLSD